MGSYPTKPDKRNPRMKFNGQPIKAKTQCLPQSYPRQRCQSPRRGQPNRTQECPESRLAPVAGDELVHQVPGAIHFIQRLENGGGMNRDGPSLPVVVGDIPGKAL